MKKGVSTFNKYDIINLTEQEMSPRAYIKSYYVHTKQGHTLFA